ncbi:MAG: hypothetical protein SVS85_00935, partial [Candidatus Nanohaloarchaea archaeon]|nr:hypothetical protein [Candidatus Nanohaloarchaea archaeon]
ENTEEASGSFPLKVTLGGETIKSETVALDAGRSKTLSYTYTVEQAGTLTFSAGEKSQTVEAVKPPEEEGVDLLPVAVVVVLVAVAIVAGYFWREDLQELIG